MKWTRSFPIKSRLITFKLNSVLRLTINYLFIYLNNDVFFLCCKTKSGTLWILTISFLRYVFCTIIHILSWKAFHVPMALISPDHENQKCFNLLQKCYKLVNLCYKSKQVRFYTLSFWCSPRRVLQRGVWTTNHCGRLWRHLVPE